MISAVFFARERSLDQISSMLSLDNLRAVSLACDNPRSDNGTSVCPCHRASLAVEELDLPDEIFIALDEVSTPNRGYPEFGWNQR